MSKKLKLSFRNIDFGPIIEGQFLNAQKEGITKFGIGDDLFALPRSFDGTEQFGFEEITPSITIYYIDNTQQTLCSKDNAALFESLSFCVPGTESKFTLLLDKGIYLIDFIKIDLMTQVYGHSHSGGNGFSGGISYNLASLVILQKDILNTNNHVNIKFQLSDYWDVTKNTNEIESNKHHLINMNLLGSNGYMNDNWKNVQLLPNWRSELTKENFKTRAAVMPIDSFEPGLPGFVIKINHIFDGYGTKRQKAHQKVYESSAHVNKDKSLMFSSCSMRGDKPCVKHSDDMNIQSTTNCALK